MSDPNLQDLVDAPPVGVVARNSIEYLRDVFDHLNRGIPVVTVRGAHDTERTEASGVERVLEPGRATGWIGDVDYEPRGDEGVAQLLFTSGTEGSSKGILLSHRALANTTKRLVAVMSLDDNVREYVGIPVHYSFGFGRCRSVLAAGGELYLPTEGFNPLEVAELLGSGAVNSVSAVPTLWRLVLAQPRMFREIGDRLRWIEIGSQYMSGDEKEQLRELFPNATIVQHYGLTEASRTTFLKIHESDGVRLESVGRAEGGVEVSLDPDARIRIRGPHLASGALRDGRVESLVGPDGWFTTSDQGHVDDGFLYFDGRADDVINCGGVKLSPDRIERELEEVLDTPGVVAVSRVPDQLRGEGVLVAVLASSGLPVEQVREAAVSVLAEAGVSAAGVVHLMERREFPTTATGKVRRRALREAFEKEGGVPQASSRPVHDPPRDDVERFVADRFRDVFGIPDAGLGDSMLASGADSLRAVELVADIDAEFGVELSLAALLRAPTLRGIADSVRWAMTGREPESHDYVVPLSVGGDGGSAALFIVGGSYGNVLHLHDLAAGMNDDLDVYGIQYRGLLNDDLPRETLAETAADFVQEVLQVQPEGPYRLSGYSGGGLIALEMARQLLDLGREVASLSMIDTRLPARLPYQQPFGVLDRQRIRLIESGRRGKGPGDLVVRVLRRVIGSLGGGGGSDTPSDEGLTPIKRRSEAIHAAFRRAVAAYDVPRLPLRLDYFRPADEETFELRGGTVDFVDSEAHRVNGAENGWKAFFDSVEVHSTPGGHYTLAHAPNASHLARAMSDALKRG